MVCRPLEWCPGRAPFLGLWVVASFVATLMAIPQLYIESPPTNTLKIKFLDVSWVDSNM